MVSLWQLIMGKKYKHTGNLMIIKVQENAEKQSASIRGRI
ncbi:MAG: hypothetical protein ACJAX4_002156 [Clostridium sp.]|jgi:hypothetical protein